MQHRIAYINMQNLQVFSQKNMFMISKKKINKKLHMQKKCNIVIRRSKNTSFAHI